MSVANRDTVVELLLHVFSGTKPPSAKDIAYREDWDYESIVDDFGKCLDRVVPEKLLEAHAESIAAFTPKGFVYFLPTYLMYSVSHVDSSVTDTVLSALWTATTSRSSYWEARLACITEQQRNAVAAYLKFMAAHDLPDYEKTELEKMVRFWGS